MTAAQPKSLPATEPATPHAFADTRKAFWTRFCSDNSA